MASVYSVKGSATLPPWMKGFRGTSWLPNKDTDTRGCDYCSLAELKKERRDQEAKESSKDATGTIDLCLDDEQAWQQRSSTKPETQEIVIFNKEPATQTY